MRTHTKAHARVRVTRTFAASLILGSLVACGAPAHDSESIIPAPDISDPQTGKGFVRSSSLWNIPFDIQVCWENPTAENEQGRVWVKQAIERTWGDKAAIGFWWWKPCDNEAKGIRIRISDEAAHTKGLGTQLHGVRDGMVLNFSFVDWYRSCQNRKQYCIEAIAVHEFGHALGFAHEQNRADTPDNCAAEPQGGDGDVTVGAWDLKSVMNYCNPNWGGDGKLSATDIAMVRKYYLFRNTKLTQAVDQGIYFDGIRLAWSYDRAPRGMYCTQFATGGVSQHNGWNDNFLCSSRNLGLTFVHGSNNLSSRCAGKTWLRMEEGADPEWRDNWLCYDRPPGFLFGWSSQAIPNTWNGIRINEPSDGAHTWGDNWLVVIKYGF